MLNERDKHTFFPNNTFFLFCQLSHTKWEQILVGQRTFLLIFCMFGFNCQPIQQSPSPTRHFSVRIAYAAQGCIGAPEFAVGSWSTAILCADECLLRHPSTKFFAYGRTSQTRYLCHCESHQTCSNRINTPNYDAWQIIFSLCCF